MKYSNDIHDATEYFILTICNKYHSKNCKIILKQFL